MLFKLKIRPFLTIPLLGLIILLSLFFILPDVDNAAHSLSNDLNGCQKLDKDQKFSCWEAGLKSTIKQKGLDAAFTSLDQLYSKDSDFAAKCHPLVHILGEAAYEMFVNGENYLPGPNARYCGYGFYHGFTEAMVYKEGSARRAREYCQIAGDDNQSLAVSIACYHGIGHGIADDLINSGLGPDQILTPSLKLCREVADKERLLDNCASGIFNSIAIAYNSRKWDLGNKNPYWLCLIQTEHSIKKPCFEEMNTLVLKLAEDDLANVSKLLPEAEESYLVLAVQSIGGYLAYLKPQETDFAEIAGKCYQFRTQSITEGCLKGYAAGLIEHGPPGQEYLRSVNFCGSKFLDKKDQTSCFNRIIDYLNIIYTKDKVKNICQTLQDSGKYQCLKNLN